MVDLAITTAWHVEAFARMKELPALRDVLPTRGPTETPDVKPGLEPWRLSQDYFRQKFAAQKARKGKAKKP